MEQLPSPLAFSVQRCESELVVPAITIPYEIKHLSDIDDRDGLRFHISNLFFYENNPSMEGIDPAKVIKDGLCKALVFYYPLAGRLIEGPNGKHMVNCNGEGILFTKAYADVELEMLGEFIKPPCPYLKDFLYNVPGSDGIIHCPLMLIQGMDIEERKEDLECSNLGIESKYDEIFVQVKKLLVLARPLMLVNILLYSLQVISVMFVGHQGELALSGASMATSFAFVTGFALVMGMGSTLETLCGQSYGANQYHLLGIHMQRAMFVNLLASIPLACIWANAGHILVILRQDSEIAAEAGIYARFMIPTIFAYALLECQIRFLQSQNSVLPMVLTAGGTALLHVFGCWVLVLKTGLGSRGAALANATSYWINAFSLMAYIKISPSFKHTWTGFSTEAFSDIPRYLKLAIPSALMICLEIWSFEMMVLVAGLLPNPKLETSVLSISLNTSAMIHMLPQGLGGATSVRVSNELGAGRPKTARLVARTATILATTEGILLAIVMISIRKVWGHCYSNEEEVVNYVGKMCFFLAGSHFLDAHQSIFSGIARGCGWQKIGAFVNLGAFYLWGIPAGIVIAFVFHVGGKGLWLGIILAIFAQALIYSVVILRTNWEKQAKKAAVRVTQA